LNDEQISPEHEVLRKPQILQNEETWEQTSQNDSKRELCYSYKNALSVLPAPTTNHLYEYKVAKLFTDPFNLR